MAQNKKSFLLYADILNTIEKLPDETAGKLFKIILEYVNDKNPLVDDLLLSVAFEPIKLQLKRDLVNWEDTKSKKTEGGQLGNLKRWQPDLYKNVIAKKITLDEAVEIAKNRISSHSEEIFSIPIKTVANVAVNDTVNVTVIQDKDIPQVVPTSAIDFNKFINAFNSCKNRNFRVTPKVKMALTARLKEYSNLEIWKAIKNAHSDKFHIDNDFKFLTPEFILRPDNIERFLNLPVQNNQNQGYSPQLTN